MRPLLLAGVFVTAYGYTIIVIKNKISYYYNKTAPALAVSKIRAIFVLS